VKDRAAEGYQHVRHPAAKLHILNISIGRSRGIKFGGAAAISAVLGSVLYEL
jgi:hypothetical protein